MKGRNHIVKELLEFVEQRMDGRTDWDAVILTYYWLGEKHFNTFHYHSVKDMLEFMRYLHCHVDRKIKILAYTFVYDTHQGRPF